MSRQLELQKAWQHFVARGATCPGLPRSEIADSWKRCHSAGIDPLASRDGTLKLVGRSLQRHLRSCARLVESAAPTMNLVYEMVKGSGFVVVLTDRDGYVLKVMGDREALRRAEDNFFVPGSTRSELEAGTNAIGLALALGKPVQVTGAEHYNAYHHCWTCSAAPVYDADGTIAGAFDLSSHYSIPHDRTLEIAVAAAAVISQRLRDMACLEEHGRVSLGRKPRAPARALVAPGFPSSRGWGGPRATFLAPDRCSPLRTPEEGAWLKASFTFRDIIGSHPALVNAVSLAKQVAPDDVRVLIQGETGTGKELLAQAIHNASPRRDGPFVAVNCAAVPSGLVESELFGYEDGAFTGAAKGGRPGKFELAHGGTLFLDEVCSMEPEMQAKILRALEAGSVMRVGGFRPVPVDVRIISAANKNLLDEMAAGRFRKDLYFRLAGVTINLPPLRLRKADIPDLACHLLSKISRKKGVSAPTLLPEVLGALMAYDWPGNVRELENALEGAVAVAVSGEIGLEDLPDHIAGAVRADGAIKHEPATGGLKEWERLVILGVLKETQGNVAAAARRLGVSRNTLYRKMKRHGFLPSNRWSFPQM